MINYQCFCKTPYYEYWGDIEKKRLYKKLIGSWKEPKIASTFLDDTYKLTELMPLGIETAILDVSLIGIAHHEKCKEAHKESHRVVLQSLKNVVMLIATSHNHGDIFYVMPIHTEIGLCVSASFYKLKTAEAYLDSWQQEVDKRTNEEM